MRQNFDKYVQKANLLIKEIAEELKLGEDRPKAYRIFKAVLHALRNKISTEESLQLISQLPMLIKGVYVDGWKLNPNAQKARTVEDFLEDVKKEEGVIGEWDFEDDEIGLAYVMGVFKVLSRHVSEGEIEDIRRVFPEDMRFLFDN